MDRLAQEKLHNAAKCVSEAHVALSVAHTQNAVALRDGDGARDFRTRLETLIQSTCQLACDMQEVAGPLEVHEGVRKVIEHDRTVHNHHLDPDMCPICVARRDTGAEETVRRDGPIHGRAGFGG